MALGAGPIGAQVAATGSTDFSKIDIAEVQDYISKMGNIKTRITSVQEQFDSAMAELSSSNVLEGDVVASIQTKNKQVDTYNQNTIAALDNYMNWLNQNITDTTALDQTFASEYDAIADIVIEG